MAPDPQPHRLMPLNLSSGQSAHRDATRLPATVRRCVAALRQWRAVDTRDPIVGIDDLEWVWSFLRRRGAYSPRRTR